MPAAETDSRHMPGRNPVVTSSKADTLNTKQAHAVWDVPHLRPLFAGSVLGLALFALLPHALGQQAVAQKHASNAQLADPKIEARANALLKQMTLEEKIGQLVQYNDTGRFSRWTAGEEAAGKEAAIVAVNPATANRVDAMQLAATGRVGSMLNTVGAARTNTYQHLAVEKAGCTFRCCLERT